MRPSTRGSLFCRLLLGLLLLSPGPTSRTMTVKQVELGEMCHLATRIFRGQVVRVTSSTVHLGGATLKAFTYRVRVDELFKGEVSRLKGKAFVDLKMIHRLMISASGTGAAHQFVLPLMPHMVQGGNYLLFTTQPGSTGLAATVGLGQGCFHIHGETGHEEALNEFSNSGLLKGLPASASDPGPLTYRRLAGLIRQQLAAP